MDFQNIVKELNNDFDILAEIDEIEVFEVGGSDPYNENESDELKSD